MQISEQLKRKIKEAFGNLDSLPTEEEVLDEKRKCTPDNIFDCMVALKSLFAKELAPKFGYMTASEALICLAADYAGECDAHLVTVFPEKILEPKNKRKFLEAYNKFFVHGLIEAKKEKN